MTTTVANHSVTFSANIEDLCDGQVIEDRRDDPRRPLREVLERYKMPQPVMLPVFGRKLSTYQLARDYTVNVLGVTITAPAGLITDGASAPWFAWSLGFLPDGLHRAGACVHDFLYACQGQSDDWLFSRKDCDEIFLNLMLRAGLDKGRARIMWLAVRIFGWWPWRNAKGPVIEPLHYEIT